MTRRASRFGLTQRVLTPEHMDAPDVGQDDLRDALRYLRRLNRLTGGVNSSLAAFRTLVRDLPADREIRVLDIGTGAADIPKAIVRWAEQAQRRVHVTAVDVKDAVLDEARQAVGDCPAIEFVREDAAALAYRFDPDSFDITHASLFLHHLNDIQVMTVLRIMQRLGRVGVIWNDLVRSRLTMGMARIATLAAPAIVKHDAIVSIRAGFTRREALDLAQRVGLEHVAFSTCLFYRFTLTSKR